MKEDTWGSGYTPQLTGIPENKGLDKFTYWKQLRPKLKPSSVNLRIAYINEPHFCAEKSLREMPVTLFHKLESKLRWLFWNHLKSKTA